MLILCVKLECLRFVVYRMLMIYCFNLEYYPSFFRVLDDHLKERYFKVFFCYCTKQINVFSPSVY